MTDERGITFRHVGYLNGTWNIFECSVCFALVSQENEDEHARWHAGE